MKKRRTSAKKKSKGKKRKAANAQLSLDKKAVNADLMALLDRDQLAPRKSPLFFHKLKKSSPAGQKVLKQNEDINLPLFKIMTRDLRRELCSRDLEALRQRDPTLDSATLNDRYEHAMLVLTKKRRANHVQSWRLFRCHKRLIYSSPHNQFAHRRLHGFPTLPPAQPPVQPPAQPPAE